MASGGKSKKTSRQSSQDSSFIDPTQLGFLQNLWQGAQGAQRGGGFNVNQNQLQGFQNQLANNPFQQQLQQFSDPNNSMVQGNIDRLGQNLGEQFNNQILPGIQSNAIQGGQLGGGRQGVAQGLAAQGMQNAFAQGASNIQNNAFNQAQQASQFGSQFNQNQALAGIGALGQQQQFALSPFQGLAGIFGSPTVIGQGSSRGKSTDRSANASFLGG
jgi:hypothetical protein